MAFQAVDNRGKSQGGIKRCNHKTTWGTVLVAEGKPCLLVDGVFYDIPFTKDIAQRVKFLVNTELNKKPINPYIKVNNIALGRFTDFDITIKYWSYVYTGQKVRCNKVNDTYIVNIDLLNKYMEVEYKKLCTEHKDYAKLTYITNGRLSSQ